jgi:NitT/TauT family transport system permease protein
MTSEKPQSVVRGSGLGTRDSERSSEAASESRVPSPDSRTTSLSPYGDLIPIATVVGVLLVVWYLAAIPMNRVVAETRIATAGGGVWNTLAVSWGLDRPVLPAPHQVLIGFWNTVFTVDPTTPKSLIYHAWVTLSSTLLGFAMGSLLGIGLAIAIVHIKVLQKSLLPWIIASQTIPILAIAPMIIVVLGSVGLTGIVPKSLISMYLCFFPVTIGMVKGLTSPEVIQLDLMHTYHASTAQTLWKLRFPAALPFLFASLKVAISIALVGAIVGELPTGAQAGIGARLLTGSYYGQTVQIWAALLAAALMAGALVWAVGAAERATNALMGARP